MSLPVKQSIRKVLIANRGEIAVRVLRACKKLGIATCVVYTTPDAHSLPLDLADEAIHIGDANAYLNIEAIVAAAKRTGADAIHPGFGFLSENAAFAERCEQSSITFIGPSSASIAAMGSKAEAKKKLLSRSSSEQPIPVIPGYHGEAQDENTFTREAKRIGYPVLLKASAGGGGKGMRVVHDERELASAIQSARREAKESFGSEILLLEKYFSSVRHVEIQIFGDQTDKVIHLYERDCSIQRRHQKVIEESPSPAFMAQKKIGDDIRERMGAVAISIGEAIRYKNAGTVEFILDDDNNFYFLEVNTRLQVEHPVTEAITGLDLVELQIRIAEGWSFAELGIERPLRRGHAIQCRLYAEDALNHFLPAPGKLLKWIPADVEGVRYDSGIRSNAEISMHYDPMVAKIIAHGPTRDVALQRMRAALQGTVVIGLVTNQRFLLAVLNHPSFMAGAYNTHFIANHLPPAAIKNAVTNIPESVKQQVLAAATLFLFEKNQQELKVVRSVTPMFRNVLYRPEYKLFQLDGVDYKVEYTLPRRPHKAVLANDDLLFKIKLPGCAEFIDALLERPTDGVPLERLASGHISGAITVTLGGHRAAYVVYFQPSTNDITVHSTSHGGATKMKFLPNLRYEAPEEGMSTSSIVAAPMAGRVVQVLAKPAQEVKVGDVLIVMESMKMETKILATRAGVVAEVLTKESVVVEEGAPLVMYADEVSKAEK